MKKDDKPIYIICPRCELNYISKKDKLCNVCMAEIGLIDSSILIPDDEELTGEKLCPVCSVNYIGEDEEICFLCVKERDEKAAKIESWDYDERADDSVALEPEEEISEIILIDDDEAFEETDEEPQFKEPNDFDYDVSDEDFEDLDEELDDEELDDDDFDDDDF